MGFRITSMDQYREDYQHSVSDPEGFWAGIADHFTWHRKWDRVLKWDFDKFNVNWFDGARLNITENCIDRHLPKLADTTAFIWEGNDPAEPVRAFTYQELYHEVCTFANALKNLGVKKGDRVCFYMPMVPELAIGILATARIGAVHSVVFAGFSARSLADRIEDASCSVIVTCDSFKRGNKEIPAKSVVDEALRHTTSVQSVVVYRRTGSEITMQPDRDVWWHDIVQGISNTCPAEPMDAEDMLFILYTSGSTGKPKGVVHTCGGYMVFAGYTFANVFQYQQGEIYWCTADIGWVTGHSYIVYGPLLNGATSVMFEGVPTHPDPGRFWEVIDKHKVNIFYTAPTAIRALQAYDLSFVTQHKLDSLRVLGSVGEPINKEAWEWYFKNIGRNNCPIVDTWWQTETGGILISPLAGITPLIPTYATLPLPGVQPVLVDGAGNELTGTNVEGNLCIRFPWPGMLRTTYGDHERCRNTYFSAYKNLYFTGDGSRRDRNGNYRIIGRVDDVINVSGHRLGTAEIENAINEHPAVVESAVVGYPHEIKGQGIYAYVICDASVSHQEQLLKEIEAVVSDIISPIARPDKVQIVRGLPKTRSGKIMRRILRKIAENDTSNLGDTSTLLDPAVVDEIVKGAIH
jgi:acetyl-CoA synthetase